MANTCRAGGRTQAVNGVRPPRGHGRGVERASAECRKNADRLVVTISQGPGSVLRPWASTDSVAL